MEEVWKPVPYEPFGDKYLVSNLGRVKPIKKSKYSNLKGEFLKPAVGTRGYAWVCLYRDGILKQAFIHRMVALAFIGEPPEGKGLVCHLDDNKLNNSVDNLMWGSNEDNMRLMVEHGRSMRGALNTKAKLSDGVVREIREKYQSRGANGKRPSQTELANMYGMHQTQISRIVRGAHWKHIV